MKWFKPNRTLHLKLYLEYQPNNPVLVEFWTISGATVRKEGTRAKWKDGKGLKLSFLVFAVDLLFSNKVFVSP